MPDTGDESLAARGFHLRHAEPADAGAILAYLRQMGSESPNVTFGAEGIPLDEEAEAAHIAQVSQADNAIFLLAIADGGIIGALTFSGGNRSRTRHMGEFGVSVLKAWWGRGVAGALLDALLAWARQGGVVRKINLRVRADNTRAIALYERLGFVREGRSTRDLWVDDAFHDGLIMGIEIDPEPRG